MKKEYLLSLAAILLMTACTTTKYVTVPVVSTDTVYVTRQLRDSIHVRDSVYIKDRGDTVTIERWHTKYVERLRTDTFIELRADTVAVPVEVTKEVPRQLTWWQRTQMYAGDVALLALMGAIAYRLCRRRLR